MFNEIFGISTDLCELDNKVMKQCAPVFERIEQIKSYNQLKVLKAFTDNAIGTQHLAGSTGYGYGDIGRDALDRVFAAIVGAEDSLCRTHFMSGTHALTVALFGLLRTGDTLLAVTGEPYDTLCGVIGTKGDKYGSLIEYGVKYEQIELVNGEPNYTEIEKRAGGAKVVHIQRSRGYSTRRAFSCEEIGLIASAVKRGNPNAIVFVDNCYGEYTEKTEPTQHGADIIVGSLIKNPGGAIAETGGYIAGRSDLVELCAHRLTAPGTGREIGCTPGGMRNMFLGVYMAPSVTADALKSAVYCSAIFERIGCEVSPKYDETRSDIVTTVNMRDERGLKVLCKAVQSSSPIDSFATPEACEMPGYDSKVIMAAGAFTCGSSIELSCDAPIRPPFVAYVQGGISLAASRLAFLRAVGEMI
ncbi:MAG: methionine gamma-lyase family protein [Oscillospiraceae bacterium]